MTTTQEKMISKKMINEAISYNRETGVFTWKNRPKHHFSCEREFSRWNKRYAGTRAGHNKYSKNKVYQYIKINAKRFLAHRLAWLICKGHWPKNYIDHINGDTLDNTISNLRDVTHRENSINQIKTKNKKFGINGVRWRKDRNVFAAWINDYGKPVYLGCSKDFFEACCIRKSAEIKYGYCFGKRG